MTNYKKCLTKMNVDIETINDPIKITQILKEEYEENKFYKKNTVIVLTRSLINFYKNKDIEDNELKLFFSKIKRDQYNEKKKNIIKEPKIINDENNINISPYKSQTIIQMEEKIDILTETNKLLIDKVDYLTKIYIGFMDNIKNNIIPMPSSIRKKPVRYIVREPTTCDEMKNDNT